MAAVTSPSGSITLRDAGHAGGEGESRVSSAILIKLGDNVLQDLKKASRSTDGLRFTTGSAPKLRIGSRTIDLSISADQFRNELFASTTGVSASDLTFTTTIGHRARLLPAHASTSDTSGTDAALEALKSSLASHEKERQAKQTTITDSLLPTPKNRYDAARRERLDKKLSRPASATASQTPSPFINATGLGTAPTSNPASEGNGRLLAMRTPVIHLLAMGPAKREDIAKKTHVPMDVLDGILQKTGKQVNGEWQLSDRGHRDLDVWKFGYLSQADRQAAVDNAIKAYDRMRLGKEEKLWQMLLPKEDRGKGIVLSKLHFGGGSQANRGLTPHYLPSPTPLVAADGTNDSKAGSTATTPRLDASTPRPTSSKGDVLKRLLSKDPKKARAVVDAKEKKRKDRDAAASDLEAAKPAKRQATGKKVNPTIKSEEIVHSSDDDDASDDHMQTKVKANQKAGDKGTVAKSKSQTKTNAVTASSDSSDVPIKSRREPDTSAIGTKPNGKVAHTSAAVATKSSVANRSEQQKTPQKSKANGLTAPNSQQKAQRSPQQSSNRPTVPSPLGAARPRVASDVSDRNAIGVQQPKQHLKDTTKGLTTTSDSPRKRHDTVTEATALHKADNRPAEQTTSEKQDKATANGVDTDMAKRKAKANGSTKRKAEDSAPLSTHSKHQKTDSDASETRPQNGAQPDNAVSAAANDGSKPIDSPDIHVNDQNGHASVGEDATLATIDTLSRTAAIELIGKLWPRYSKTLDEHKATKNRGDHLSAEEIEKAIDMHAQYARLHHHITRLKRTNSENPLIDQMSLYQVMRRSELIWPLYAAQFDANSAIEARGDTVPDAQHQRLMALHREYAQIKKHIEKLHNAPDPSDAAQAAEVERTITFNQGVGLADKFLEVYYPAYVHLGNEVNAKVARGEKVDEGERERLWGMHRRIMQMQREMQIASEREGMDGYS